MKHVRIVFEDSEFEALREIKGKKSWHDFILDLAVANHGKRM